MDVAKTTTELPEPHLVEVAVGRYEGNARVWDEMTVEVNGLLDPDDGDFENIAVGAAWESLADDENENVTFITFLAYIGRKNDEDENDNDEETED